ncbi:multiple sugar transport system substrate-binding protein [Phyllobacterium trifolii]|uniref:Multiple sugar transport system substrate-binding protein n=1 Tax=Phyllobacterium trifolii TaxID=300193 RepID=A0A839UIJ5_9HYPH|nr:extracellular solute-binding protein [Phyllobacterium trifolii]MBB3149614.1 multiple sugar transport system substrate-binding protein [Phyllobacterium trifolii]
MKQPKLIGISRRSFLGTATAGAATLAMPGILRAQTELRYLNHETDPRTVAFLRTLAADYEKEAGVRVRIETEPDPWVKLTTSIKAGKPYDFMSLPSITDPVLLAKSDAIVPVTDIVKEQGIEDFGPRSLSQFKDDIWGYPYDYNSVCLYYRSDWLSEKGLRVPTDWDSFIAVLQTLHDPDNRRYGYTQTLATGGDSSWANTGFLWSNDVRFYDEKWDVILDTPDIKKRTAEALAFIKKTADFSPPGLMSAKLKEVIANFVSGTAAVAPYAGRLMSNIQDNAPELADKFVLGPYVRPKGGQGVVTGGVDVFAIGKTDKVEEAKKLLRWMIKNDKITDFQLTLPLHYQPVQFSSYQNKRWSSNPLVEKYKDKLAVMRSFLDEKETKIDGIQYQGPNYSPNQGRLYNSDLISSMYQNVVAGKMSPEEAVDLGAAKIRELTDKV